MNVLDSNLNKSVERRQRGRIVAAAFLAGLTVTAFLLLSVRLTEHHQRTVNRLSALDQLSDSLAAVAILVPVVAQPASSVFATGEVATERSRLQTGLAALESALQDVVSAEREADLVDASASSRIQERARTISAEVTTTLANYSTNDRAAAVLSQQRTRQSVDELVGEIAVRQRQVQQVRHREVSATSLESDSHRASSALIGLLSILATLAITYTGRAKSVVSQTAMGLEPAVVPEETALIPTEAVPSIEPSARTPVPISGYVPFSNSAVDRTLERQTLGPALRLAVERDEIQVFYLPEIELGTLRVTGLEALSRWVHPERGLLSPQSFLAIADDSGAITRIGRTVLRQAVQAARRWQARPGQDPVEISINLTANQLEDPTTLPFLARVLDQAGIPPHRIVVDIPEHLFLRDLATTERRVSELQAIGVRIGIDDVGIGYRQLSSLDQLAVDVLKISRSVVDRCGQDDDALAVVDALVWFGNERRLKVVAKGVERFEQLSALWSVGCRHAQGYFFSEPIAARDVDTLLAGGTLPDPRWHAPAA